MVWFKTGGKVLKVDGKIAVDEICCCEGEPPPACCCPQFVEPFPLMDFELTGFLTGKAIGVSQSGGGACAEWLTQLGELILDEETYCAGDIVDDEVEAIIDCDPVSGIISGALLLENENCEAGPLELVSQTCNFEGTGKFRSVWNYTIIEAVGGGPCACPVDAGGQMIVTEQ